MTFINETLLSLYARIEAAKSEEGASMAEYGLLLALVAVVALTALTNVGTGVSSKFQAVASSL